ncbi:MAG: hypothetical protein NXY57DRAFT_972851 [Lentinula lateritia]|nr:MAG: hypothetical protein NXY57DRAFT_972851 [Lentinula lateritia]
MKILSSRKFTILIAAVLVTGALAETHTVVFTYFEAKQCNIVNWVEPSPPTVSPLIAGIAYLDVGEKLERFQRLLATYRINAGCGADGQGCAMVKTTLVNPTTPGSGPSTDITLTPPPPPHSFSVTTDFGWIPYDKFADISMGATVQELIVYSMSLSNWVRSLLMCALGTSPNCPSAFHNPDDTRVQDCVPKRQSQPGHHIL